IGFIGAGNMAEAIIGAILSAGLYPASAVSASDPDKRRLHEMEHRYQISRLHSNRSVVRDCDLVFLAVKPQTMNAVLQELSEGGGIADLQGKRRLVSIAAGIRIAAFEAALYKDLSEKARYQLPIIRVMPNTPALVQSGTSAVCANAYASPEDMEAVKAILSAMGTVFECPESAMDAFTAVAGSGPAYGFYLMEAVAAAGVELGLSPDEALQMTVSTLKGALDLLQARQSSPEALRRKVTSPGGTTEAAVDVLEKNQVKKTITQAVLAAARRAGELSG
ncbi:MAG TPA: pyrroline-5-carboxylate reductase, partial [Desulfosalsimonadaceae bacterium]|nr:pyrroline-5-carboxylate reductase [Desulfosalsimonadaceae bacterium]